MSFTDTQNPGIGGLDELTNAEELFLTSFAGQTWTEGDLVYYDGVTLSSLPIGSAADVLTVSGGLPTWQAPSGGAGLSDGDKGDITVSGSGATWTIDSGVVSLSKMADVATSTVFYRKTASTGAPEVQTLATLKTDLGLTGTNSGDQTSIVGITGTKSQFNTAVTDGDFLYVGDITQYTDEMAQDAVGVMVDTTIIYTDATPLLSRAALSGAITASAGSNTTSLGSFTLSQLNTALSDADVATGGGTATGTNTGDQTSIVGISGTKAQFNTALSDGDFLFSGDVTQYTDEMAQDAIGTMIDTSLTYVDGTPLLQRSALTGDVTASAGSNSTTIANSVVTFAKIQNITDNRILGRAAGSSGVTQELTVSAPLTIGSGTIDFDETATLGNNARIAVAKNSGATVGTRRKINFIEGTNVTLTVTDDSVNEEVEITIAASGGSGVSDGDKGDITVSSSGSTWTIDSGVVSLAKMADMATASVIYRKTAGTGVPEVQTLSTLKTDLGLTGTNSGDQTSIVGITGTKAQFDTAVTDGNFLYVGDVTQYTDELAQDAIGAMVDTTLVYTDGTPLLSRAALTGAITASAGSNTTSLGSFTKSQLSTAVSDGDVLFVGDVTSNATHTGEVTGSTTLTLDATAITNKTAVTAVGTDYVLISDTSDSGLLKKALASDFAGSGGVSDGDKGDITVSGSGATWTIDNNAVTFAKMQAISDGVLLGASGGTAIEEITVGSGLSLSANTLSATGGGGGITQGQAVALATGYAMV